MNESKNKAFQLRVKEEDLIRWKNAALDQRYMNLSQFVRDAIEEKIKRYDAGLC